MTPLEQGDLPAVLAGLAALGLDVALDPTPGSGWTALDRYAEDTSILHAGLRLAGQRFGAPDVGPMNAGWFVGDIAAAIAWPAVAALLTYNSLLVSDARDIHVPHPAFGRRRAARITPTSPAGRATPQAFAAGIVTALEPIVDAAHDLTRRGRHALWGTVTDMVAAAFHRVGDHLDRRDDAKRTAELAIDHADTLVGGTNWHDVTWSRGIEHTRIRNICCCGIAPPPETSASPAPASTTATERASSTVDTTTPELRLGHDSVIAPSARRAIRMVGIRRDGAIAPALDLSEIADPAHPEEGSAFIRRYISVEGAE